MPHISKKSLAPVEKMSVLLCRALFSSSRQSAIIPAVEGQRAQRNVHTPSWRGSNGHRQHGSIQCLSPREKGGVLEHTLSSEPHSNNPKIDADKEPISLVTGDPVRLVAPDMNQLTTD